MVTAMDDDGATVNSSFTMNVNAINDEPVVQNAIGNQSIDEDFTPFTIQLAGAFSDVDGDALTYSVSGTSFVTAAIEDNTLTITAIENAFGMETITVTASDGELSATGTCLLYTSPSPRD